MIHARSGLILLVSLPNVNFTISNQNHQPLHGVCFFILPHSITEFVYFIYVNFYVRVCYQYWLL